MKFYNSLCRLNNKIELTEEKSCEHIDSSVEITPFEQQRGKKMNREDSGKMVE